MYDEKAHWSFDALLNLALGESQRDFGEIWESPSQSSPRVDGRARSG